MRLTKRSVIIAGVIALGAVALTSHIATAIVVAPTAVYFSNRSRSASITLYNPEAEAEEVSIETLFGYPATDSLGNVYLYTESDSAAAAATGRSAADWIRAYPRRVTIPAGGRQVVRLLVQPPADLPEGEYWTRIVVTSRGQKVPVSVVGDPGAVTVGIDLEVRTIIAASYRNGDVSTGVRLSDLGAEFGADSLTLRPKLVRTSDGAYIGRLRTWIVDTTGEVMREWEEQVAVYQELHRRLSYDVSDIPSGSYWVHVEVATVRPDVPQDHLLTAAPVRDSALVVRE